MKELPVRVRSTAGDRNADLQDSEGFDCSPFSRQPHEVSASPLASGTDAASVDAARQLLARFADEMRAHGPRLDLARLPPGVLALLNEALGEGEVNVRIAEHNGEEVDIRIGETAFAGVWRERHLRGGVLAHDWLHAAAVPRVVVERARHGSSLHLPLADMPRGALQATALLAEIRDRVLSFKPGRPPHVINLTLLSLTAEDHSALERIAAAGPVAILSRGFGNCRMHSTRLRNLWRVQYFNGAPTPILDTLEVTEIPESVLAAAGDLADSRERLRELVQWLGRSGVA